MYFNCLFAMVLIFKHADLAEGDPDMSVQASRAEKTENSPAQASTSRFKHYLSITLDHTKPWIPITLILSADKHLRHSRSSPQSIIHY